MSAPSQRSEAADAAYNAGYQANDEGAEIWEHEYEDEELAEEFRLGWLQAAHDNAREIAMAERDKVLDDPRHGLAKMLNRSFG